MEATKVVTTTLPSNQAASEFNLRGRRVLVTGAARGLGASIAQALVHSGATVVLTDLVPCADASLARNLNAEFFQADLTQADEITSLVERSAQAMGGLDALINNAAVTDSGGKNLDEISVATWDHVMAVNVRAPWLLTCAARPHLKESGSGRIVNIASDTALWGAPRLLAYVTSKGALMSMTRSMARELGPDAITVNAIAPGLVVSESTEYVPAERHDWYLRGRALQRPQMPEDIHAAISFFVSRSAGFVTGQVLPVNGGFVMY
jgi:NAD(P)-dependent dehydrogenase (short-subunit alcohol dehydrogenase family)